MIQINSNYGLKSIFANVFKNVESVSVSTKQFTPDSLHTNLANNNYKLFITNQLTGKVFSTFLTYDYSDSRGAYFTFELGDGTNNTLLIDELGTFTYEVYNMTNTTAPADRINVLDSGLFRIYNNVTFEDNYFDADKQTIPTTKVYKPS